MIFSKIIFILFSLLYSMTSLCTAQNNIRIDDTLSVHAEKLELFIGHVFMGKIKKFHFGPYSIDAYKYGSIHTKRNRNFLGTKKESRTTQQSSFILRDSTNNTSQAVMVHHTKIKVEQNMIMTIVDFGEYALENLDYFTTWITINGDTSDIWTLFIGRSAGIESSWKNEAFMTNGKRNIILQAVAESNKGFNAFGLPSMGYEFIEDGQSIAALQYFNGEFGKSKNTVWMDARLTPKMKLVLATASIAIVKHANTNNY